jgi:hypothetical protein
VLVDDSDKKNKVSLGFVEMTLNYDTRDLIDGVFYPGLLLLLLQLLELLFK